MKRILVLLLLACTALGDERAEKRQLVSELLEVMDAKAILQASLENFTSTLAATMDDHGETPSEVPDEFREQWEESQRQEAEKLRVFRERLFANLDYDQYFEETYFPMFEEQFTVDELRALVELFRTKHGQKLAKAVPRLVFGAEVKGMKIFEEASKRAREDLAREEAARNPWRKTLMDMRAIATSVEARATDTNEYPNVSFEELARLIAPTYIREVPMTDTWGTRYFYVADGAHYRIVSAGADRQFEWSSRSLDLSNTESRISEDADADIIFQDGIFLQAPREQ